MLTFKMNAHGMSLRWTVDGEALEEFIHFSAHPLAVAMHLEDMARAIRASRWHGIEQPQTLPAPPEYGLGRDDPSPVSATTFDIVPNASGTDWAVVHKPAPTPPEDPAARKQWEADQLARARIETRRAIAGNFTPIDKDNKA